MNEIAQLSNQNQLTLPKKIRTYLGIKQGENIEFFIQKDGLVVLQPQNPASALTGLIPKLDHPISVEEMNNDIENMGKTSCLD